MIKVGDIIDGKRVTKVFTLCGSVAYQSEPVGKAVKEIDMNSPVEPITADQTEEVEPEKPRRGRRKKEA